MATDTTNRSKTIAKNTIVLYIRMIFVLGVALYTSRTVLEVLGVEDYGMMNVVGGIVSMLGFFNGAMISSTQRFFSYPLAKMIPNSFVSTTPPFLLFKLGWHCSSFYSPRQ